MNSMGKTKMITTAGMSCKRIIPFGNIAKVKKATCYYASSNTWLFESFLNVSFLYAKFTKVTFITMIIAVGEKIRWTALTRLLRFFLRTMMTLNDEQMINVVAFPLFH